MRARLAMLLPALLAAIGGIAGMAGLAGCGGDDPAAVGGDSTLRGTLIDPDGDGALDRGPGEPLRDRGGRGAPGAVLATVVQLTDLHVRDEESPGRAPYLDRLGVPFGSTFRPHESLSTQVLAAAIRAANAARPDAAFVTGDLLDSASAAEADQALAVLDGGEVDPDTGRPGYQGVQEASEADPLFYRPALDAPRHPAMLAAAARPFGSPGLRAPWYPALGNHDLLVQGETPPTAALDAFATGTRMVTGLDPAVRAAAASMAGCRGASSAGR